MNLERKVLNKLMEGTYFGKYSHLLDPKMFSEGARHIYNAFLFLYSEDKELNKDNVLYQLQLSHCEGKVLGLFESIEAMKVKDYLKDMIEIFVENFKQNAVKSFQKKLTKLTANKTHSNELLSELGKLYEFIEIMSSKSTETLHDVADRVTDIYKADSILTTGFKGIDKFWTLMPGNTYCVLGDTNQGKSSVGFAVALRMAYKGHKVAYVSVEVSKAEMLAKAISLVAKKDANYVMKDMPDSELKKYAGVLQKANIDNLFIIDELDEISEILAEISRIKKKNGVDVVIIDHIQLLTSREIKSGGSDEKRINDISKKLKRFSSSAQLPVIELGQLNSKDVERNSFKPSKAHCRHSSAPVNDATGVIIVHRPSTYNQKVFMGIDTKHTMFLINDKGRFGGVGTSVMDFQEEYGKMSDLSPKQIKERSSKRSNDV